MKEIRQGHLKSRKWLNLRIGEENMSHVVNIKTELKNKASVVKACARLEWPCEVNSSTVMYDGTKVHGSIITIPNWKYAACVKEDGSIATDTFNNRWGDIADLDQLKKYYAVEETKSTLAAQGIYSREYLNEKDQSITLTAEVHH
jgi:hypothetical protein